MIETPASQNSFSIAATSKPERVEHVAGTVACVTGPSAKGLSLGNALDPRPSRSLVSADTY